jgi:cytochrome P450
METTVFTADQLSIPAVAADPYPVYRQLREHTPLNYIDLPVGTVPGIEEPLRAWALMKYDDVYGTLRDHDTFSSARNPLLDKGVFPRLVLHHGRPPAPQLGNGGR